MTNIVKIAITNNFQIVSCDGFTFNMMSFFLLLQYLLAIRMMSLARSGYSKPDSIIHNILALLNTY